MFKRLLEMALGLVRYRFLPGFSINHLTLNALLTSCFKLPRLDGIEIQFSWLWAASLANLSALSFSSIPAWPGDQYSLNLRSEGRVLKIALVLITICCPEEARGVSWMSLRTPWLSQKTATSKDWELRSLSSFEISWAASLRPRVSPGSDKNVLCEVVCTECKSEVWKFTNC